MPDKLNNGKLDSPGFFEFFIYSFPEFMCQEFECWPSLNFDSKEKKRFIFMVCFIFFFHNFEQLRTSVDSATIQVRYRTQNHEIVEKIALNACRFCNQTGEFHDLLSRLNPGFWECHRLHMHFFGLNFRYKHIL